MAYTCDVTVYFRGGQPDRTVYIGEDRKARDQDHAVLLAKMDMQAKGWDLKLVDSVHVTGGKER